MRFYFLNIDIGLKYAGVEASSILRSELFFNELNIEPTFITAKYKSFHAQDFLELKRQSRINVNSVLVNAYDILQNINRDVLYSRFDYAVSDDEKCMPVSGFLDKKIFDENDKIIKYIVYHKVYNLLHYINHFNSSGKWRRDYYDCLGFLSCTQFLRQNKVYQEIYYRPDSSLALIKNYYNLNSKVTSVEIQILDDSSNLIKTVLSEEDLVCYALLKYFSRVKYEVVLIIDRCRFYYPIAAEIKNKISTFFARVFVIPVIHNLHLITNTETGAKRINYNYLEIFKSPIHADAVLVQTEIQRNEIANDFKIANAFAIPHSYNNEDKITKGVLRNNYKAIYLARYSKEKRHELAILAFSKVVESIPEATFYCYGFGSMLPELKKLVVSLGLEKNIFLCSWTDSISEEYQSAALSIISSQSESFSLTIAESLAYGCPVVAFDVPYGPRELILNGVNGYLVSYPDVHEMAAKVISIMNNKNLLLELSTQAKASAVRYSEATVSHRWISLFNSLGIYTNNSSDAVKDLVKSESFCAFYFDIKEKDKLLSIQKDFVLGKNIFKKTQPASIVKLLTVITACSYLSSIDSCIKVFDKDILGLSANGFKSGDIVTVEDLFVSILLAGSNIASNLVARAVGELIKIKSSEYDAYTDVQVFVKKMNEISRSVIGMKHSFFKNPHGLYSKGQYSCAFDLALLLSKASEFKQISNIWGEAKKTISIKGDFARTIEVNNTFIPMIRNKDILVGGKTGSLGSMKNLAMVYKLREDFYISIVTLNSKSETDRDFSHQTILSFFKKVK